MTLPELMEMDAARSRSHWDHTAQILCLVANVNRGKDDPPVELHHVHPFIDGPPEPTAEEVAANWEMVKSVFVGQ